MQAANKNNWKMKEAFGGLEFGLSFNFPGLERKRDRLYFMMVT